MAEKRFVGGLRFYPAGNATAPLAELLIDDQRVVLRLRWGWLRRLGRIIFLGLPTTWEAPRERVAAAESRGMFSTGVLLKAPGQQPAMFWCDESTRRVILATLQAPRV